MTLFEIVHWFTDFKKKAIQPFACDDVEAFLEKQARGKKIQKIIDLITDLLEECKCPTCGK